MWTTHSHREIYNKCNTCNAILHCWEFIGNLSPIKAVTLWEKKKKFWPYIDNQYFRFHFCFLFLFFILCDRQGENTQWRYPSEFETWVDRWEWDACPRNYPYVLYYILVILTFYKRNFSPAKFNKLLIQKYLPWNQKLNSTARTPQEPQK